MTRSRFFRRDRAIHAVAKAVAKAGDCIADSLVFADGKGAHCADCHTRDGGDGDASRTASGYGANHGQADGCCDGCGGRCIDNGFGNCADHFSGKRWMKNCVAHSGGVNGLRHWR
ncbi:hypothetical protein ABH853_24705 [Pseudomonas sp. 13.2]|uniref:Uncharacterized protein n=1 Tax=Pseudomonas sp. 13.2 TaxID=3144665 RepID=A0AAU7BGF4_9PSED